jgi:purine-cytosine permease-like protein
MMQAVGLGAWGAVLMTVATLTTNFVNIYMSALALRSLAPKVGPQLAVWSTGLVGAALSVFSGAWLDHYANFMLVLGGVLVPVGGVLVARFFLVGRPGGKEGDEAMVAALYDTGGPTSRWLGFDPAGIVAWLCGGIAYFGARSVGGTLPSLLVSVTVYWGLAVIVRRRRADADRSSRQPAHRPSRSGR